MPTFITIGYGDQEGYDRTDAALRDQAHAHDAALRDAGVRMGAVAAPVQVRNHDAQQIETSEGPFMRSALPLAGFAVIEAADLDAAIAAVAGTPCAVNQGVVEVWPLQE